MARNFLSAPFAPYNGTFSSKPFRAKGRTALMIAANVFWPSYTIGGQSLGGDNSSFNVTVDLNVAITNQVPQTWAVQSVYVDNENVNFSVYVYFPDTQFAISCPPNASGWFTAFTAAKKAFIIGVGIATNDILNSARTTVFFTDADMAPYLDPEQATAVDYGLASPLISFGGGGGALASIGILAFGSNYTSGALNISGAGGTLGAASGTIDSFGRFTSVNISGVGSGYVGPPVVTATGAKNPPAAWNAGTSYTTNQQVTYKSFIWIAISNSFGIAPDDVSRGNNFWTNTGIISNQTASFNPTVTPIIGGVSIAASSSFGARALGDQLLSRVDSVVGLGLFADNLFGTPFGSGFIYITGMSVQANINGSSAIWQLQESTGHVIQQFFSSSTTGGLVCALSNLNIKIPATLRLQLVCTTIGASTGINTNIAYTFSPF